MVLPESDNIDKERFTLLAPLGEGGTGCVYEAWDHKLRRRVAIKMLQLEAGDAEELLTKETIIAQKLSHPSIVRIHDVCLYRGNTCISMELIHGVNLAEYVRDTQLLNVSTIAAFAYEICEGLLFAHKQQIIHCDLKPANILIDRGRARITDFGLSLDLSEIATGCAGTPTYMAPEQKQNLPVDHRTDIYAYGLILFELLCGRRASIEELKSEAAIARCLVHAPPQLSRVVVRCLQWSPPDRYSDCAEILRDLKQKRFVGYALLPKVRGTRRFAIGFCVLLIIFCFARFPVGRGAPAAPVVNTIAVLPFTSDNAEIVDGIEESIRTNLASRYRVWSPDISQTKSLPLNAARSADLILRGRITGATGPFVIELEGSSVGKGLQFRLKAKGDSALDLERQIWDRLAREPLLRGLASLQNPATQFASDAAGFQAYSLAVHLLRRGSADDANAAVTLLTGAIATNPRCAKCYAHLAEAELFEYRLSSSDAQLKRAVSAAESALILDDTDEQTLSAAVEVYHAAGRLADASALLQRQKEATARSAILSRLQGTLLAENGSYSFAKHELLRAVELNRLDVTSLAALGEIDLMIPDYAGAIAADKRILEIDPTNPIGWNNLGAAYIQTGRFHDAVSPLKKVLETNPSAESCTNLAMALFFSGERQLAIPLFIEAASLSPTYEYLGNLAHVYRWLNMRDKSDPLYRRAIAQAEKEAGRNGGALADLGIYHAALGHHAVAQAILRRLEARKSDLNILYKECIVNALLGRDREGLDLIKILRRRGYPLAFAEANPDLATLKRLGGFSALQ